MPSGWVFLAAGMHIFLASSFHQRDKITLLSPCFVSIVATLKLGMTIETMSHLAYKTLMKIDKQLKNTLSQGPSHLFDMIEPIQEKFNNYWSDMKDFAAINQVFDPCCKLEQVEFILLEEHGPSLAATSIQKIKKFSPHGSTR
jgi:hypothetical protein